MIDKTIHYCWFGGKEKSELSLRCIASWARHCPDYNIVEWNETNFCIKDCPDYVKEAYSEGLYAFVSDYARLKIIYEHGGIYLDTDVELLKPLDSLLKYNAFFGFEDRKRIATGLGFGAEKGSAILKEMMVDYWNMSFKYVDGTINYTTCPDVNTHVFLEHGLILNNKKQILENNILILPTIYLCPINYGTDIRRHSFRTISIHWFAKSWMTEESKQRHIRRRKELIKDYWIHMPNRVALKIIGKERYETLKKKLKQQ